MAAEIALKLAITLIALVLALAIVVSSVLFVVGLWSSQLDPWQTVKGFFTQRFSQSGAVITRDPNHIYQDGKPVGRIEGEVVKSEGTVEFALLADTADLDRSRPFQYQRLSLLIKSVHGGIAALEDVSPGKARTLHNVMQRVVCGIQP